MSALRISMLCAVLLGGATPTKVSLRGVAETRTPVCGNGLAITEEQREEQERVEPLRGVEFVVIRGRELAQKKIAARFTTDSAGAFSLRLPPGTWCVFRADRTVPEPAGEEKPAAADDEFDRACLRSRALSCDAVVEVSAKRPPEELRITINAGCPEAWNQPCYRGPLPQ